MSPLSHLMIMWLLLCNLLKLTCFTNMTSMNDCYQSNIFLDYVKIINLLKCKIIIGGVYK